MDFELTDNEIETQDVIDNICYRAICEAVGETVAWNIEQIGEVRDALVRIVSDITGKEDHEIYP